MQINKMFLSRQCEAWFWGEHVCSPVVRGTVATVASVVREKGAEVIAVEASLSLNPENHVQECKVFTRRLQKLAAEAGYTATELSLNEAGFIANWTMRRAG